MPGHRDRTHPLLSSAMTESTYLHATRVAYDTVAADYAEQVFYVPKAPVLLAPLLTVVPLHLFALELATAKGHDVDQPRNLAKSVTVE